MDTVGGEDGCSAAVTDIKVHMKWRRSYLLVLAPVLLIAVLLLALPLPPGRSFQVKGPLSAQDVGSIRRELRRAEQVEFRYSILHRRLGSFWDHLNVVGTCPLVSIESSDGSSAAATFQGRTWTGNKVWMQYMLSKKAEAWSCTTVSSATTVVRAR